MLEELKMPVSQLKEDIEGVWSRLDPSAIQKKIDEKMALTEAPGFWDDHEKAEKVMSKQLLRSGTSIGANFSESLSAESDSDFIHKLAICQKEANETLFWLELLQQTNYLTEKQYDSLNADCIELRKIITSIILTTKQKKSDRS